MPTVIVEPSMPHTLEKPPGKIMSKLMQSGFAQNWFFKKEEVTGNFSKAAINWIKFSQNFALFKNMWSIRWISEILNTETQNIFCFVNENSTTFLYTLNRRDKKTEGYFFFFKVYNKVEMLLTKKFGF